MSRSSMQSICAILTCTPTQFFSIYDDETSPTHILCNSALDIIAWNHERLRAADQRFHLDEFVLAMLTHAPCERGKRYVAVALHIAYIKEGAVVVDVVRAWMEHLFLPMLTTAKTLTEPSDDWAPFHSLERSPLEEMIAVREQYKCAITGIDDMIYIRRLAEQGLPTPARHDRLMAAAYIIPFPLDKSIENSAELIDPAHMRDMLVSWTDLDMNKLTTPSINSPANAILMTLTEHSMFGNFQIYLDKDVYPTTPNKYMVRIASRFYWLSNERTSADVEFRMRDGVQPPDPEYLAAHAAIAKVVNACGVADYVENIDSLGGVPLWKNSPADDASALMSKLAIRDP